MAPLLWRPMQPSRCQCLAGEGPITGLDIGCGTSLIYPLLGAAIYHWHFVAADVTDVAVEWAQANVDSNPGLSPKIEVRRTADSVDFARSGEPSLTAHPVHHRTCTVTKVMLAHDSLVVHQPACHAAAYAGQCPHDQAAR